MDPDDLEIAESKLNTTYRMNFISHINILLITSNFSSFTFVEAMLVSMTDCRKDM